MSEKELKPNTIVYFLAHYDDDDGKPAKGRRHLVVECENDKVFLLKITGKRKRLHQVTIGLIDCLDKISHSNLNRKLSFSISQLENSNYKHFYICPFHSNGCLDKENFKAVKQKLQKYWNSKFNRNKKEVSLDGKLKAPKKLPKKWKKFYL